MIALIAAMQAEVDEMLKLTTDSKKVIKDSFAFWEGKLENQSIIIMLSGVGKGNAAMAAAMLITNYRPQAIINIGTAGGLCDDQEVLDVVIGTRVVQHDFDTSPVDGDEGIGLYFDSDQALCDSCKRVCEKMQVRNHSGLIASGDQFIDLYIVDSLLHRYSDALCAEMEAGAIAQACTRFQVPFVILRSLSDIAVHDNNHLTYQEYVALAASRSARMCKEIINEIACE